MGKSMVVEQKQEKAADLTIMKNETDNFFKEY